MRNGDVVSAAVLVALGVFIIVQSWDWTYSGEDGPGPAFFPIWYGIALVVLSLALIIATARAPAVPSSAVDWTGVGRALATWAAFALSAMAMAWLGFLVSFALLTFVMMVAVFQRPVPGAALAAVVIAAAFYLVFPLALGVALPVGFFGF